MARWLVLVVCSCWIFIPVAAAQPPTERILTVTVPSAQAIGALGDWVAEVSGATAVGPDELVGIEPEDAPSPLAQCERSECFAAWARAAGCSRAVAVKLERLKGAWRVTVRLIDANSGALLDREVQVVRGRRAHAHGTVPTMLGKLFGRAPEMADPPVLEEPETTTADAATEVPGDSADVESSSAALDGSQPPAPTEVITATAPPDIHHRARRVRLTDGATASTGIYAFRLPDAPPPGQLHKLAQYTVASPCRRGAAWACEELGRRAEEGSRSSLKTLQRACDRGSVHSCEALVGIDETLPFGNGARVTGGIFLGVGVGLTALGLLAHWGAQTPSDEDAGNALMSLGGVAASTGAVIYLIGFAKGSHAAWRSKHPAPMSSSAVRGVGMGVGF